MNTITIRPDGTHTINTWPSDGRLLQHLYAQIGCSLVSPIELAGHLTMWCDDEGLLVGAELNTQATKLLDLFGIHCALLGTVVLTGPANADGGTLPLDSEVTQIVDQTLKTIASMA